MPNKESKFTVLELCAGGGGQALGLEAAGFKCVGAVEIDPRFCETLRLNRPAWNVIQADLKTFKASSFKGVDLVAGGVPCPPFSIAGKQLGADDGRDLFPSALRIVKETQPKAVLLENVSGFASKKFDSYRKNLITRLKRMGYVAETRVLNASDFGVPQLRPRFILVALRKDIFSKFKWPESSQEKKTVGEVLHDLMAAGGWTHADAWAQGAAVVAPTLVGGSTKHGGPDLGPTRARKQWATLGVDGLGIADAPPTKDSPITHKPKLTVRMAARIQGFPDTWQFAGRKTMAYRQIGNAFPPPVAKAVGFAIQSALRSVNKK